MTSWVFGVEIEIRAKPHKIRSPLSPALYYEKLAAALRNRDLKAKADNLASGYGKHPEHYDKWWITKDGSLGDPTNLNLSKDARDLDKHQLLTRRCYTVAIEAVSPILRVRGDWEDEIDTFWSAMRAVFHMPERSPKCGSHVHISPGQGKRFKLSTLKKMAYGIVLYEPLAMQLLMANRTNNQYCQPNSRNSAPLARCAGNRAAMARLIQSAATPEALRGVMQNNRYVLWNFDNIAAGKSGTVEFRGGRCLRGEVRTKRWIAFAVCFLCAMVDMNDIENPNGTKLTAWTTQALYEKIKSEAAKLSMDGFLPDKFTVLNESQRYVIVCATVLLITGC
jgi:hypothetical protein